MKKFFVTILSTVYLLSGIGFISTQHYCQSEKDLMSKCQCQCCPTEVARTDESLILNTENNFCCTEEQKEVSDKECETRSPDNCCNIEHKYIQIDNSSIPVTIDLNSVSVSSNSFCYLNQQERPTDFFRTPYFFVTSKYINAPLLI